MNIKKEILVDDKSTREGISKKTGNNYKFYELYVKDDGIISKLQVDERMFNKTEKGKKYILTIITDNYGNPKYNDIELLK